MHRVWPAPIRSRTSLARRRRDRSHRPAVEPMEGRILRSGVPTRTEALVGPAVAAAPSVNDIAPMDAAAPARLLSVTFGGSGFHPISSDPNPRTGVSVLFDSRQWTAGDSRDPFGRSEPVLYAGGSTLDVSASWRLTDGVPDRKVILARAFGSGGIAIGPTVALRSGDGTIEVKAATRSRFADIPSFTPQFAIRWQLSFDHGKTWSDAGVSDNPLYVSSGKPIPDPESGRLFLTVVNTAIRRSAGVSGQAAEIAAIWGAFTGLKISRFDGAPLEYYGSHDTQNTYVNQLLRDGDGQCSTFTKLFLDMLMVDGIRERDDYLYVRPMRGQSFLIKQYEFLKPSGWNPRYPYLYIPKQYVFDDVGNRYRFSGLEEIHRDPESAANLPGQNSPNPASLFDNHQVARLNGTIYDPSYGVTFPNLAQDAASTVVGYGKVVRFATVDAATLGIKLKPDAKSSLVTVPLVSCFTPAANARDTLVPFMIESY